MRNHRIRDGNCEGCGAAITKVIRDDKPNLCGECAAARMADAARQMAARCGPVYDAWLKSRGPVGRPRKRKD